jgi:hypothetical protein
MLLTLGSRNRKVGKCAVTYLPFRTCPPACRFRNGGCYAMGVLDVAAHVHNIERQTAKLAPIDLVRLEGVEIIQASKQPAAQGTPLRLHVSGDVRSRAAALELTQACRIWKSNGGGPVWTYTHSWRTVPSAAWQPAISIWASVDNPEQAKEARGRWYPPAMVVPYFDGRKAWDEGGTRWIACPAQTRELTCDRCRICWKGRKMIDAGRGVAFEAHGGAVGRGKAIATARVLTGEQLCLFGDSYEGRDDD